MSALTPPQFDSVLSRLAPLEINHGQLYGERTLELIAPGARLVGTIGSLPDAQAIQQAVNGSADVRNGRIEAKASAADALALALTELLDDIDKGRLVAPLFTKVDARRAADHIDASKRALVRYHNAVRLRRATEKIA